MFFALVMDKERCTLVQFSELITAGIIGKQKALSNHIGEKDPGTHICFAFIEAHFLKQGANKKDAMPIHAAHQRGEF